MEIRRIVTGHDEKGRSRIARDSVVTPRTLPHDVYLWTTDKTPASNRGEGDAALVEHKLEPPRGGSVFRYVEIPPESGLAGMSKAQKEELFAGLFASMGAGHCRVDTTRSVGMHKTRSVDYVIVLKGQITAMLDEGEVTLRPFDVVVQRGTNHDWVNRGTEPALLGVVMIDADQT